MIPKVSALPICIAVGAVSFAAIAMGLLPESDALRVTIQLDKAANAAYALMSNDSDEFFCIGESAFDGTHGNIMFFGPDGKPVHQKTYADAAPDRILGFDFTESYIFVRPHEARKVYFDIRNFEIVDNRSRYKVLVPYYRCRDVIDSERSKARRNIEEFVLRGTGELDMNSAH